jgi:hypothetical protein
MRRDRQTHMVKLLDLCLQPFFENVLKMITSLSEGYNEGLPFLAPTHLAFLLKSPAVFVCIPFLLGVLMTRDYSDRGRGPRNCLIPSTDDSLHRIQNVKWIISNSIP